MTYCKVDINQSQIVEQLRIYPGISVKCVHIVKNFADILVGFEGRNYLFEIKTDVKKKLTEGEIKFQNNWTGQIDTIYSANDILRIIGFFDKLI